MIWFVLVMAALCFFMAALIVAALHLLVWSVRALLQTILFVLILLRVHWRETADRREVGAPDHRISWPFIRRVWRNFRDGVYAEELAREDNLR